VFFFKSAEIKERN